MITYHFLKKGELTLEDIYDLSAMLKQLTTPEHSLTLQMVEETIAGGDVLVARDKKTGRVVGTISLFKIPTLLGIDGLIENIIVDKGYRKQGIGQVLMEKMFQKAQEYGWHKVEWTSGDHRRDALSFYRQIPEVTYRPQSRYVKVL